MFFQAVVADILIKVMFDKFWWSLSAVGHWPARELGHARFVLGEQPVDAAGVDGLYSRHRLDLRAERQRVLHLGLGQVLHQQLDVRRLLADGPVEREEESELRFSPVSCVISYDPSPAE